MVQDKLKNPLNLTEHWKSETNLSRTMKFILDFWHRLSIGPVRDKIHGLRQICLRFPVLFFYLSRTFQCLLSLSCLYRQQQVELTIREQAIHHNELIMQWED